MESGSSSSSSTAIVKVKPEKIKPQKETSKKGGKKKGKGKKGKKALEDEGEGASEAGPAIVGPITSEMEIADEMEKIKEIALRLITPPPEPGSHTFTPN